MAVKHSKVASNPDGADPTKVQASNWNEPHVIEDGTVTLAQLASVSTSVLLGRASALTGVIEQLTPTQAKALLAIAIADVAGLTSALSTLTASIASVSGSLAPIATSGSASDLSSGAVPAARLPALTGDVTTNAGSVATTIAASSVSNAKLANAPAATLKGNVTGAPAAPQDLTASAVKTLLAIAAGDVSGLASIATSGSAADLAAGTIPAARLAALTGDVTSNAGSAATTIATGAVSNAKLANMAAGTFKANSGGAPAAPGDLTASQAKALLAIAASDVSGLATVATTGAAANISGLAAIATSGSAADLSAGTIPAARMPAHTGDVTSSAGSVGLTIANDAVSYAKLQNISATQRALGRNSGGAGDAEEVSISQLLDWASSAQGAILARGASAWAALANVAGSDGDLELTEHIPTTTPASGKLRAFASSLAGRSMLGTIGPSGARMLLQPYLGQQHLFAWLPTTSATVLTVGITNVTIITATGGAIATTNSFTHARRCHSTSPATSAAVCGYRTAATHLSRQQGFFIVYRFGIADGTIVTTGRTFVGLSTAIGAPTDVDPSGQTNILGVGTDANDTTLQLYAAGSSAQSRTQLVVTSGPNVGGTFPMNTTSVDMYELAMFVPAGGTLTYEVTRLNTGDVAKGTVTAAANLPSTTTLLTEQAWRSNGATAAAVVLALFVMAGDTDT